MALTIKIENFEGPFDLLLHLIKKNEMDIYNVRLHEITTQYLDYLKVMKEMDLEIASEFIVIAASLLEMKSKLLLPKTNEDEEDSKEEDPAKALIFKLVEYKKYKMIADYLKVREEKTGVIYTKKPEIINDIQEKDELCEDLFKNITMLDLYKLFDKLMSTYLSKINTENRISSEIPVDKYRIEDKMESLLHKFDLEDRILFSNIKSECSSKIEVVVTFLALLELIKLRDIKIIQESSFREIFIERIHEHEEV